MEIPDYLHGQVEEAVQADAQAAFARQDAAERAGRWAVVLGLRPFKDGNAWCVLWGDDLQDGIAAFGDSPEDAIKQFDEAMRALKIMEHLGIGADDPVLSGDSTDE